MTPLPEALASILKTNATAALAALMIVANAHRDLFNWASRTIIGDAPAPDLGPQWRSNGGGRVRNATKSPKRNGVHREPHGNGAVRRRAERDKADSALAEAMRDAPGATIGDWAHAVGRSKSSTVSDLHRLRDAGLAENVERRWRLIEEPAAPKEAPRWVAPLKGKDRSSQAHLTAAG